MDRPKISRIEFQNLNFQTPNGQKLLDQVNFCFPEAGVYWLKSDSGAGKSTLLRLLDGLVFPSAGTYSLNGHPVNEMSFLEFNPYRLQFGLSFDFGGLINNRTLHQNLSLILEYHKFFSYSEIQARVTKWLEKYQINEFADVRPSAVPGAVRKVICVLRAFVHEPQVLLLDDPSTGLRKEARKALIETIQEQKRNGKHRLIVIATEDQEFIKEIRPDGVIELKNQKLETSMNETWRQSA